jgi:SPP1 gp7 family putative phage head morphogenesis protein
MPDLRAPTARPIKLKAIRANAGVEAKYRAALQALIAEMAQSVTYWTRAAWRKDGMAMDRQGSRTPLVSLRGTMQRMARHWQDRFDSLSDTLAAVFVDGATAHTDAAMMAALKDAGFTVKFKLTDAAKEGYQAVLQENVGLIKSIPAQYLQDVQGDVWRAVAGGYDLKTLTDTLQSRYGVTHKRAALIARDQSNKAKAVIENVRRQELGITTAIWQHSGAGREPRPSHVAANGKVFELAKGMLIDGEYILPGTEINCRCTSKAVIPGFED